jgi:hypothetical protein
MALAVVLVSLGIGTSGWAQPAPAFTVTFGGQFRVAGIAFDNLKDFENTDDQSRFCTEVMASCKDSDSFLHERFRLFTTIESADKKARVYWALEVGDIAFGAGGGASGAEYGGSTTRVGPSSGGGLGNDGANVETKNAYLWFEIPGGWGGSAILGLHNIVFLSSPTGAFMDDDAAGIQLNWKSDFADVQFWLAKTDENNRFDADDNTMYALRLGVNATKDLRFTLEGLVVDQQCFARRSPAVGSTCVSASFGDTFWVGGTVGAKVANINLDGTVVYGQRQLFSAALDRNVEESGFGLQFTARLPIGPVSTWFHAWYTTGDERRIVGTNPGVPALSLGNRDFSTVSNTTRLTQDSDKLPVPIGGASWLGAPFVAEALIHGRTTGNISFGQPLYNDATGTWGIGGSATYALLPSLSVGGGVAYVEATEKGTAGQPFPVDNSIFDGRVIEFDAGLLYTLNPQTSFQLVGSYLIPGSEDDDAWAVIWRALYAF